MSADMKSMFQLFAPLGNHKTGPIAAKFGGYWLPAMLPLFWGKLRSFSVRPDDVFICSFPKTGTNWLNYIVYMIQTGNIKETKQDFNHSIFELPLRGPNTWDLLAENPSPRRMITHLPASLLPTQISNAKIIYIFRDVKDTCVSMYYHYQSMAGLVEHQYRDTFDNFARLFMQDEILGGPYHKNLKAYLEMKNADTTNRILFVRFEELKKDTAGGIKRIAEFLGTHLDDDTIKQIVEAASVDKMRANDAVNWSQMKKMGIWQGDKEFIRKGEVGDWRNHFTDVRLLAEFDEYVRKNYPMELFPDYQ